MSLAARLERIRPKAVRWLAKGVYYALTLQLFRRMRARLRHEDPAPLQVPALAKVLPDARTWLEVAEVRSRVEYERALAQPAWRERMELERRLAQAQGEICFIVRVEVQDRIVGKV